MTAPTIPQDEQDTPDLIDQAEALRESWGDVGGNTEPLLGYKAVAAIMGISDASPRGYFYRDRANGKSHLMPTPDGFLIVAENSVLPGWYRSTIEDFLAFGRVGPGNHTRGDSRSGYAGGRIPRQKIGTTQANTSLGKRIDTRINGVLKYCQPVIAVESSPNGGYVTLTIETDEGPIKREYAATRRFTLYAAGPTSRTQEVSE
jgi:hypothetical protein